MQLCYSLLAIPYSLLSRPLHLLHCGDEQLAHFRADIALGHRDALGGKVAEYPAQHAGMTGLVEIGCDHLPGVGLGLSAALAELVRGPQPEQPVAAGFGLKSQVRVVDKLSFEGFLALVESRHGFKFRVWTERNEPRLQPMGPMPR